MTAIELRALVARDGRLLFFRPLGGGPWTLPGGSLEDDAEDVDAAMESLLRAAGIVSENVAEDFLETAYLPGKEAHGVLNLYAPANWAGEPVAPHGHEHGWFNLDELERLELPGGLLRAVLGAFGMADGDDDQAVMESFNRFAGAAEPMATDRRAAGLDVLRTLGGGTSDGGAGLRARMPEIAGDVIDFALGEVWSNPALDRKTRSLEVVAMLAALGGRAGPLRSHINGALNHGATPEQVVQTLRMVAVYAGFPAALEAWPVMEEVFKARGVAR